MTDRYTKAIEQLGSEKLDVRIGGIYALERIARDSARDHPTVMEVLAAFIREHSREHWPLPEPDTDAVPPRKTRPDVQAAVTVIGRRVSCNDRPGAAIDLLGAKSYSARTSTARTSPARISPARTSFAWTSLARTSQARTSELRSCPAQSISWS